MKEWCRLEAFLEAIDRKLRSPVLLSFVIGGTNLGSQLIKIQFQKSRRCYVPRRNMRKPLLSKELSMKALNPSPSSAASKMNAEGSSQIYSLASTTELSCAQVERLRSVLNEQVEIHGRGNFPTLSVRLHDLIVRVRDSLRAASIGPKHVKMNGGAASYVVATEEFAYSDLDLIFPMSFEGEDSFEKVRIAVFDALVQLMPDSTNKEKISADTLKDIYIRKMVKVSDGDRWSLFSLHNDFGRCIELKFVDRMRRQFEFSVDSFQITLDVLLDRPDHPKPIVTAESMFGDINKALQHLNERLIDTRRPEEIRGGGLLKYCHLLTRGYKAARPNKCRLFERYMCSRFFIDFPDVNSQEVKLRAYLDNHFGTQDQAKYEYLLLLYRVISESTVCLMSHERRQTLAMVDRLAYQLSVNMYYHQSCMGGFCGHTPRQTLLYLPPNASYWIPVV
uniref:polynucleotide adenylyltransferase n=1 Tax=Ascaris suum TaxID=6253 RepID=F1KV25_ASCSU